MPVRSLVDTSSVNFSCEEFNPLTAPGNRNSTCCSFFDDRAVRVERLLGAAAVVDEYPFALESS